jgi:hypothetical protein
MPKPDPYDEYESREEISREKLEKFREILKKRAKEGDLLNEVGKVEPLSKEDAERRDHYSICTQDGSIDNWPAMHREIFTESSGLKEFGKSQLESIHRTHYTVKYGGKSVIGEPRGFGKTTRTSNNCLAAVLQGDVKYALILASSVEKATDILEGIKTELIDNDALAKIYPAVAACFLHAAENPIRARQQTYGGKPTFVAMTKQLIRFPVLPDEPSSGGIIQVRTKDNVRGLAIKMRYGPDSGKVLRPQFAFFDDIQTDEEAESPTAVRKIIQTIKKSVLYSGSHSRRISTVMCCTPISPGDVSSHFILDEPSWDCVVSKMVYRMPDNMEIWLNEYSRILLDFDRHETGSRKRAQLRARKFVEDNYEEMHKGSEVGWDWAYGWSEDPQTEVSALHHAMNFLIEEGQDSFESECQCNVQPRLDETTDVKATMDEILEKVHPQKRGHCPVETKHIVTHIDVNKNILTYATVASAQQFRPMAIDYGTYPNQRGSFWKKNDLVYTIKREHPDIPEFHEALYQGLKNLLDRLAEKIYTREDGQQLMHDLILVDMGYRIDEVQRAIRDSKARAIACCYRGQGIQAKDKPFMDRNYQPPSIKHFHCATVPSTDRTLNVLYSDVNYFKTQFHKGIKTRLGLAGSFSLFSTERIGEHLIAAQQCVEEVCLEDVYDKESRTVIIWDNPKKADNEFFDNFVGAMAGLFKVGCELRARGKKGSFDIQDYVDGKVSS